jgi:excisionase family DNA binding protein
MKQATVSNDDDDDRALLWSVERTAKKLGVSEDTVWREIARGNLAAAKVGRRHMVQASSARRMAGQEG